MRLSGYLLHHVPSLDLLTVDYVPSIRQQWVSTWEIWILKDGRPFPSSKGEETYKEIWRVQSLENVENMYNYCSRCDWIEREILRATVELNTKIKSRWSPDTNLKNVQDESVSIKHEATRSVWTTYSQPLANGKLVWARCFRMGASSPPCLPVLIFVDQWPVTLLHATFSFNCCFEVYFVAVAIGVNIASVPCELIACVDVLCVRAKGAWFDWRGRIFVRRIAALQKMRGWFEEGVLWRSIGLIENWCVMVCVLMPD